MSETDLTDAEQLRRECVKHIQEVLWYYWVFPRIKDVCIVSLVCREQMAFGTCSGCTCTRVWIGSVCCKCSLHDLRQDLETRKAGQQNKTQSRQNERMRNSTRTALSVSVSKGVPKPPFSKITPKRLCFTMNQIDSLYNVETIEQVGSHQTLDPWISGSGSSRLCF